MPVNAAGSCTAISARTLRSISMPALRMPLANWLYVRPFSRAAALIRATHSGRNTRFLARRSGYAYWPAFTPACLAMRKTLPRRSRKPLARARTFLWRARAVTPRLTRGMFFSCLSELNAHAGQHGGPRKHVGFVNRHCTPPGGLVFCGVFCLGVALEGFAPPFGGPR